MNTITSNKSLISNIVGKSTNNFIYILYTSIIGSILLAVSSKIQIPLTPVPVTLQTLVLLVMSMFLGWRSALGATTLYLFQGAIGLPVFAHGAGLVYLFGPTGGYLLGFILASVIVGFLAEKGWDRSVVLTTAIVFGLLPFITPDLLKICLGTCMVSAGWEIKDKFLNK